MLACASLALTVGLALGGERDADRDGLSDFAERNKYFTNPERADSDGDGLPDGDWDERREFAYSLRAVLHVMAPFDLASMNDDYQDVRALDVRGDLLEFEVVIYPFNSVAEALEPNERWQRQPAEMKPYLAPGACSNWDADMQAELERELAQAGVELGELDDAEACVAVARHLLERAEYEDGFTTFAVEFDDAGLPRVSPRQQADVDATLRRFGRTLEEQWDRELFGKGMFTTRRRGSCTSSAIYLATGLKAAGIPARTVVCVPLVDANDAREVEWLDTRIEHVGVRAVLRRAAAAQRGSWTSHTFNEVFVGGRWRRLNYDRLGQNVLDADGLGLMVHVHTFNDHSAARLEGWGNREAHPQHAALFGGPNPYSCVSLSDRFGAHAKVENAPLAGLRELTITALQWYDDPERPREIDTDLGAPDGSGYLAARFERGTGSASDALAFYLDVAKDFALRARGRDDVPLRGIQKFWGDNGHFILRIAPDDFARMQPGVAYELAWTGPDEGLRWIVRAPPVERPE